MREFGSAGETNPIVQVFDRLWERGMSDSGSTVRIWEVEVSEYPSLCIWETPRQAGREGGLERLEGIRRTFYSKPN